jgi:hypothetical protein
VKLSDPDRIAMLERRLTPLQAFVDSETRARRGITLDEVRPLASQAYRAGIRAC